MRPIAVRVPSDFSLFPACCIHWPIGDKDLLRQWVALVKKTPNGRAILLGDSLDIARTHYRNHIRSYRDDENSQDALDEYVRDEVRKLASVLVPIKERIWGAICGNHFWEFQDGTNSEQYLCQLLGIPYLGPLGLVRVACGEDGESIHSLTVFAHHTGGSQGGRTIGGDANALTRQEPGWDADIYLLGHTHRRYGFIEPVMSLTSKGEPRIVERPRVFVRAGSFLKAFSDSKPNASQRYQKTYAEDRALRPTSLGWVRINVRWTRAGTEARRPKFELVH